MTEIFQTGTDLKTAGFCRTRRPKLAVLAGLAVLMFGLGSGCANSTLPYSGTPPLREFSASPDSLAGALAAARRNMLEIRTAELLNQLAGEYRDNRLTIGLSAISPGEISGVFDSALAYSQAMNDTSGDLLPGVLAKRSGQLLDAATANAAAALEAEREKFRLGESTADRIAAAELELRILTGWTAEEIAAFAPELAEPFEPASPPSALRQYAACRRPESRGTLLPEKTPEPLERFEAEPLNYANVLFTLPSLLARRGGGHTESVGAKQLAAYANAFGVFLQVKVDLKALERAKDEWEVVKNTSGAAAVEAKLRWRKAWHKLAADLGLADFTSPPPAVEAVKIPEFSLEMAMLAEISGRQ